MNKLSQNIPHKLGTNRKEVAQKMRKHDANFSQSRDIREDRGERQIKMSPRPPAVAFKHLIKTK